MRPTVKTDILYHLASPQRRCFLKENLCPRHPQAKQASVLALVGQYKQEKYYYSAQAIGYKGAHKDSAWLQHEFQESIFLLFRREYQAAVKALHYTIYGLEYLAQC